MATGVQGTYRLDPRRHLAFLAFKQEDQQHNLAQIHTCSG